MANDIHEHYRISHVIRLVPPYRLEMEHLKKPYIVFIFFDKSMLYKFNIDKYF